MAKRMQASSAAPRRRATRRPAAPRIRKRRRRPTILLVLALTALVAGFLFRRMMLPEAAHYLAYRPANHPAALEPSQETAPNATGDADKLTESDRHELDATIRSRPTRKPAD